MDTTATAQLYEQLPSGPAQNHAYQSSTSQWGYRNVIADSFQVTQSTLLTRIMWWGVYDGEAPDELYNESFIIKIHADTSGQPGAVLATFDTGALTTSRTATGRTLTFPWEWSDPVPLQANTTYWLVIEQTTQYTPPVTWHWSHSAHPDNRGVMNWSGDPVNGYWFQQDQPWDLVVGWLSELLILSAARQRQLHRSHLRRQRRPAWRGDCHLYAWRSGIPHIDGREAEYEWPQFPAAGEFFYSMVLPAPLTLQANTRYWISINTPEYPNYVGFGWEYSAYNGGPGLYGSFADPVVGPWQHWGNLMSGMAFRLDR